MSQRTTDINSENIIKNNSNNYSSNNNNSDDYERQLHLLEQQLNQTTAVVATTSALPRQPHPPPGVTYQYQHQHQHQHHQQQQQWGYSKAIPIQHYASLEQKTQGPPSQLTTVSTSHDYGYQPDWSKSDLLSLFFFTFPKGILMVVLIILRLTY